MNEADCRVEALKIIGGILRFLAYEFIIRVTVRTWMSPLLFHFFNIFVIALFQNILLLSITTPAYIVLLIANDTPLYWADVLAVQVIVTSLGTEAVADEQQW
ncbi:hypothetical protein NEOLI_002111 [Neolecta irregularis DAH-3]|uniref:Transmembrane protein n=1 Tax=Neolecta irregularis (strain DAH-3) TaxID=1198029 RepID=A0A1U7LUG0_NEOID|nr:hypothetical protein NEOLI_002111 [Neolecta irregularis DAH-3]|eukprot:OLL26151.1 hypothetical protein NEOLI_002111 [Neolecta irregularis DAH-3]